MSVRALAYDTSNHCYNVIDVLFYPHLYVEKKGRYLALLQHGQRI